MITLATKILLMENRPLLLDRIQSMFIDLLFVILLMFGAAAILDHYENPPDWIKIVLFFGLWAFYEPFCTSYACTIGNYLKGIRVRKYSNSNKRINILQAFIRYITKSLLGWISFLTIHLNSEKRAIHDFVSGSIMVKL